MRRTAENLPCLGLASGHDFNSGKRHHLPLIRKIPQCYILPGCCHCGQSWFLHLKQTSVINSDICYAALSPCILRARDIFLVTSFLMFSVLSLLPFLSPSLSPPTPPALLSQFLLLLFTLLCPLLPQFLYDRIFWEVREYTLASKATEELPCLALPMTEHRGLRRNLRKYIFY